MYQEEKGPFSKSTHPCKNDQSHEFPNGESLADQRRRTHIMRETRGGYRWKKRGKEGGGMI